MLAARNAARKRVRLVRKALSHPNANARRPCECPSFAPAPAVPAPALATAGEASARATALRRPRLRPASCPRPSSARPFARPRPASRAFLSRRLHAAVAQSDDMQSVLCFGPRPCIPSARSIHSAVLRRVTYRGIVRSAAGAHFGRCQPAAREPIPPRLTPPFVDNSSGASRSQHRPRPRPRRPIVARFTAAALLSSPALVGSPDARRPQRSLASLVHWELPPAARTGAVAPRVLAAPLRWRLGAPCAPLARCSARSTLDSAFVGPGSAALHVGPPARRAHRSPCLNPRSIGARLPRRASPAALTRVLAVAKFARARFPTLPGRR
jgi:hypothetical protein